MCALRECVHTGIGSASAVHPQRRAGYFLDCSLKMILNSTAMFLTLPANEAAAIVRDDDFQPSCIQ